MYRLRHTRKLNRLKGFNYARPGYYFITLCVKDRRQCFGSIQNGKMTLNLYGSIIKKQWKWVHHAYPYVILDTYIIMPDHFHAIVRIDTDVVIRKDTHIYGCRDKVDMCRDKVDMCRDKVDMCRDKVDMCRDKVDMCRDMVDMCWDKVDMCRDRSRPVPTEEITEETQIKIKSISDIIGAFKTTSSKLIHQNGLYVFAWQRSFYDRIIHNLHMLNDIRIYIKNNPQHWEKV